MVPILLYIVLTYFVYSAESTVSCSFDSGLCGWHGVGNSTFQWKSHSGPSPDRTSGPLNDHTCNNYKGQYVFITGDDVRSEDDSAALESETIVIDEPTTFGFWILMNGIGVGNLSLIIRSLDENERTLWSASGRQGRRWQYKPVKLEPGNFTLRFEATVRLPYASDLAIDDIRLMSEDYDVSSSHCKLPPTTTSRPTTASTTILTTEAVAVTTSKSATEAPPMTSVSQNCSSLSTEIVQLPGSCDFDKNVCGNKIIPSKDNRDTTWNRTKEGYGFDDKRIASDHSGKGYYMHFKIGSGFWWSNPQYVANMETPDINSPDVCLTFWYNMPSEYSNLRVYVASHGAHRRQVWARNKKPRGRFTGWYQASFAIHQEIPFKIIFATVNNNGLARVGIDDISILGKPSFSTKPPHQTVSTLVNTYISSTEISGHTNPPVGTSTTNLSILPLDTTSSSFAPSSKTARPTGPVVSGAMTTTVSPDKVSTDHARMTSSTTMNSTKILQTITHTRVPSPSMPSTNKVTQPSTKTSSINTNSTRILPTITNMHVSLPSTPSTNEVTQSSTVSVSKKPKPIDNTKSVSNKSKGDNSDLAIAAGVTVSATTSLILLVMAMIYTFLRLKTKLTKDKEKVKVKSSALNGDLTKSSELGIIGKDQTHIFGNNNNLSPNKQTMNGNLKNGHTPNNGYANIGSYTGPADDYDANTHF